MIPRRFGTFLVLSLNLGLWACNDHPLRHRPGPSPSAGRAGSIDFGDNGTVTPKPSIGENPKVKKCLNDIKQKMINKQLFFVDQSESKIDDKPTAIANRRLKDFNPPNQKFFLRRQDKTNAITTVGVTLWSQIKDDSAWESFEVTLERNENTSKNPFQITIDYSSIDKASRPELKVMQVFGVNDECQLTYNSSNFTSFEYIDAENFRVTEATNFSDSGDKQTTKDLQLKNGEQLASLIPIPTPEDIHKITQPHIRLFSSLDLPMVSIRVKEELKDQVFKLPFMTQEVQGTKFRITSYINEQSMFDTILEIALPLHFSRQTGPNIVATVDKDFWLQANLSDRIDGSQLAKVNITNTESSPLRLQWTFENPINFDLLTPYWKVLQKTDTSALIESLPTSETQSIPLSSDSEKHNPYLKETSQIQISLPQIQKWKQQLLSGFQGTRAEMTVKIRQLIPTILVYDHEMVANNLIRALTTEEILHLKKGVCQHFSVLFTTIARSVGLPTRIISGYLLDAKSAGPHVWVEVELQPGIWKPIEPQEPSLDLQSKRYIPLSISGGLDDPTDIRKLKDEFASFQNVMTIESAP